MALATSSSSGTSTGSRGRALVHMSPNPAMRSNVAHGVLSSDTDASPLALLLRLLAQDPSCMDARSADCALLRACQSMQQPVSSSAGDAVAELVLAILAGKFKQALREETSSAVVRLLVQTPVSPLAVHAIGELLDSDLVPLNEQITIADSLRCAWKDGQGSIASGAFVTILSKLKKWQHSRAIEAITALDRILVHACKTSTTVEGKTLSHALTILTQSLALSANDPHAMWATDSVAKTLHRVLFYPQIATDSSDLLQASRHRGMMLAPSSMRTEIKLNALGALSALVKAHPQAGVANWSLFMPGRYSLRHGGLASSLTALVLADSSFRVRGAAAGAVAQLLHRSHRLLRPSSSSSSSAPLHAPKSTTLANSSSSAGALAAETLHKPSFLSLSQRMSQVVTETYQVMATALREEQNPTALAQVVRCATALFTNAPPPTVSEDAVTLMLRQIQRLAFSWSTDATVRSGAVSSMAALLTSAPSDIPLIADILGGETGILSQLVALYGRAGCGAESAAVVPRVEVVHALASASVSYAPFLIRQWSTLSAVLADALEREQACALRLHAARCVQNLGHWNELLPSSWWWEVLRVHLKAASEDSFHSVRAAAVSTLALIPNEAMVFLETDAVASMVLTAMYDGDAGVRMNAASTAGAVACLEALRSYTSFLTKAVQSLLFYAVNDKVGGVRARCFASLAYASEARICSVTQTHDLLAAVCLGLGDSRDKVLVLPCVLRAAGALVSLFLRQDDTMLRRDQADDLIEKVAAVCRNNGQHVKVRWNACHALSYAVEGESTVAIEALCSALMSSTNFKVCIAACKALSKLPVAQSCAHSSDLLQKNSSDPKCWISILAAMRRLEQGEHIDKEKGAFQHKETLRADMAALVLVLLHRLTPETAEVIAKECGNQNEGDSDRLLRAVLLGTDTPEFAVEMLHRQDDHGEEARSVWRKATEESKLLFVRLRKLFAELAPDTHEFKVVKDVLHLLEGFSLEFEGTIHR